MVYAVRMRVLRVLKALRRMLSGMVGLSMICSIFVTWCSSWLMYLWRRLLGWILTLLGLSLMTRSSMGLVDVIDSMCVLARGSRLF